MSDRFMRLPEVIDTVGLGRDTIYRLIREGTFPQPAKLTPGGHFHSPSGWLESEIRAWIESRPRKGVVNER